MPGKICKNCKSSVSNDEYFCPKCGTALFENADDTDRSRRLLANEIIPPRPEKTPDWQSAINSMSNPKRVESLPHEATRSSRSETTYDSTLKNRHEQPAMPAAGQALASGFNEQGYNRDQIRELLQKDKARKKKFLMIGLPVGIIVIGAIALILVLFVFGGGISPEQYKKKALEIHKPVMEELNGVNSEGDIDGISQASDALRALFTESANGMEDAIPLFEDAEIEIENLKAPESLLSLKDELSAYYRALADYYRASIGAFNFVAAWYSIWEEYLNFSASFDKVRSNMTNAQVAALLNEDISKIAGFISQFQSLTVPAEYQSTIDRTVALISEDKAVLEKYKASYTNSDEKAWDAAQNAQQSFNDQWDSKVDTIFQDLYGQMNVVIILIQRGTDLENQLSSQEKA